MTLVDWAALIGALAWVPVIVEWIAKAIRKCKISVIIDRSPEIGYTTLGSILNYRIALTAENGPVVVNKMEIILLHESGEKRVLTWQGMIQSYGSMTIDDKKMPLEKDQVALAIKINDNDVEERFFRFQDAPFNATHRSLYRKVIERLNILRNESSDYREKYVNSDEMHNLKNHLTHGIFWKTGKYTAEVKVSTLSKAVITGNKFLFTLSILDIERLRENISQIDTVIKNEANDENEEHGKIAPTWNWQYPLTEPI